MRMSVNASTCACAIKLGHGPIHLFANETTVYHKHLVQQEIMTPLKRTLGTSGDDKYKEERGDQGVNLRGGTRQLQGLLVRPEPPAYAAPPAATEQTISTS